jgi:Tetratricopeptide repeat
MNNLANVYRAQNKNAQAEPLYRQTLEIRRRVLGFRASRHTDLDEQSGQRLLVTGQLRTG